MRDLETMRDGLPGAPEDVRSAARLHLAEAIADAAPSPVRRAPSLARRRLAVALAVAGLPVGGAVAGEVGIIGGDQVVTPQHVPLAKCPGVAKMAEKAGIRFDDFVGFCPTPAQVADLVAGRSGILDRADELANEAQGGGTAGE